MLAGLVEVNGFVAVNGLVAVNGFVEVKGLVAVNGFVEVNGFMPIGPTVITWSRLTPSARLAAAGRVRCRSRHASWGDGPVVLVGLGCGRIFTR